MTSLIHSAARKFNVEIANLESTPFTHSEKGPL
jgi:hypothetical protein